MTGSGRIVAERGELPWAPATYEPPAMGGGYPPGWTGNEEPFAEAAFSPPPVPRAAFAPVNPAIQPEPNPSNESGGMLEPSQLEEELRAAVEEIFTDRSQAPLPKERVNVDEGTAVFAGHTVKLTPEGLQGIRTLLAMEVCNALEQESKRVLSAVQQPGLPPAGGAAGPNVPQVPSPQTQVGSPPPSGERAVS